MKHGALGRRTLIGVWCGLTLCVAPAAVGAQAADEAADAELLNALEALETEPAADPAPPPAPAEEPAPPAAAPAGREKVDQSVRAFFDEQTHKGWQYLRPELLMRTGAVYEEWDETNRVLRQSGFKVYQAKLGFRGKLDPYPIDPGWDLFVRYRLNFDFAGGAKLHDSYGETEVYSDAFAWRMRVGVMKVPFLHGELVGDEELIFPDRPQYVKPYGAGYLNTLTRIGLDRQIGAATRFGVLKNAVTLEGGGFTSLDKPKEEVWGVAAWAARAALDTQDWIHDRIRLEAGTGYYYQKQLPLIFENSRQSFAADARLYVYGAFLGAEWALQETNDRIKKADYARSGYKNTWSRAMGYQVYVGYAFPKREYEFALRYQWWDPDDTNVDPPVPQNANQARRWITLAASWWPIDLFRVMASYTHRMELEAVGSENFSAARLKDVANDEVVLLLQITL